jgi:orotidine-5'-phosphate decarboxylase
MPVNYTTPASRIIPALDMPWWQAGTFVERMLKLGIVYFKVGFKSIHSIGGPQVIADVLSWGGKVVYDAKLHDTNDTVGDTVMAIVLKGASGLMLHASSSMAGLKKAVANARDMTLFGVTVPTDIDNEECYDIYRRPLLLQVPLLANRARGAGLGALICSPLELELDAIKELPLLKTTPGIRPVWAPPGQQKRFTTPLQAIKLGADGLVIGSPLYAPPAQIGGPEEAAKRITGEVEEALRTRL